MAQPFRFMLDQTETKSYGDFIPRNLRPLIDRAIPHARAQISGSPVVAIGLASSSQTFFGVNVELPGVPLNYSIHAEQFLVANLALHSELQLKGLAISTNGYYFQAPCDHCCQFLKEVRDMALRAATMSYARFSKCPSGVALIDRRGTVYSGWFMESVAHNPSLGPVQAALVDFVINGDGQEFKEIVEAVLVEKRGAVLSQEDTARMILEKIADPDCIFRVSYIANIIKSSL
ncbi:Cytidine deaminase-like [Arabidopsis thaliana x Arabidopsis arenosa]|uniref:Cytidine deaminase-like n=1 Tax=Arabidopsis thaliana x Arabidopsis arenosa TaxID=1240361 RepID=A0A8T1YB74_9BRAS|nr:Cytidine deaminase-like [Arabidopsis thaliana x Arabidopsis arenosa]